jgi:tetratricopeptide (TPR) repeat protein
VKTFLPETVQIYSVELFNANTPATDALCAKLLSAVTDAFPDHPYAYNLKAALADATGKPEEALRMLETAHQKAPDDTLILTNVAEAYAKAGQTENAVGAYEKLLKLELDADSKREAEAALAGLRKKAGTGASKSEPVAPAE